MSPDGRLAIIAAPTNLGLRPPEPGSVPGCAKAPEALRQVGLHRWLAGAGAADLGVVLPGRYVDDDPGVPGRLRNQDALVAHARRLAERLGVALGAGLRPLVLGGDCSVLIGVGVALRRRGRFGLVHLDGHTDFRHPGNTRRCRSLAGEDLAAATGHHWPAVADIDGLAPYVRSDDAVHVGCRDNDEHLDEARSSLALVVPAAEVEGRGAAAAAKSVRSALDHLPGGYWLHLDVDILDPLAMPAVDSPDPGGLRPATLTALLRKLAPAAVGATVAIYDPDLDPRLRGATLVAEIVRDGLGDLGADLG